MNIGTARPVDINDHQESTERHRQLTVCFIIIIIIVVISEWLRNTPENCAAVVCTVGCSRNSERGPLIEGVRRKCFRLGMSASYTVRKQSTTTSIVFNAKESHKMSIVLHIARRK